MAKNLINKRTKFPKTYKPQHGKYSSGETEVLENEINTVKDNPLEEVDIQNAELQSNLYVPQSETCTTIDTVTPASMRYDMHKAIETINRRVNGVDEYVAEKLGYMVSNCSIEQRQHGLQCLCDAFSAEQVDAIAVAIYNIEEKRQGCIIGDQTGIGKGRIAAAMIRYGYHRGLKPIFLTEKPNLFSDIYRDIIAIGSDDGIPVDILDGYKQVAKTTKSAEEVEDEEENGDDPDETEFVSKPVYRKNKQYPEYTFSRTDKQGNEETVTKKGKLFMRPFILNGEDPKTIIKDEQGNILYRASNEVIKEVVGSYIKSAVPSGETKSGRPKYEAIASRGSFRVPDEYDFVLATYSQFRGKALTLKMEFLQEIARGNIIIMDESHNASGDSNTGKFLMTTLENSMGVTFLSATFAKRPDNMPIYASKTAMSDANLNSEQLVEAITIGGVALQEIIASNLTAEGQMIRRERSFEGIETNYDYLDHTQTERGYPNLDLQAAHEVIMDSATEFIRTIIAFQRDYVNIEIERMDSEVKDQYMEIGLTKGTSGAGVDNQPIFSGVFNIINQLLFSIKADAVAQMAVRHLKEGRKPVIAFANTMESFLSNVLNDDGTPARDGDVIRADFAKIFERRLHGVLKYTITDSVGNKETKVLDIEEMSPQFRAEYGRIMKKIQDTSIGICSSPIDVLIDHIEKAGFSVAEVTGRSKQLKLLGNDMAQIRNRTKIAANDAFRMFNNNQVDALLINQSGSTGASAHAIITAKVPKEKVKQRVMLILQAELNINTEVQKRGRINRTGQILKPVYGYPISAIPAEKRLMMMLQKKLKSLDANTTSSQKRDSDTSDSVQVDFLNKYGDKIVYEYLKENKAINALLGDPLKRSEKKGSDDDNLHIEDAAHKVSGRVAILPVRDQESFYTEITQRYNSLVDYLKQTGDYDLEIVNMNLEAEVKETKIVVVGKGGDSAFGRNSILEKCVVNNLRKPYDKKALDTFIREGLAGLTPEALKMKTVDEYEQFIENYMRDYVNDTVKYYEGLINNVPNELQAARATDKEDYISARRAKLMQYRNEDMEHFKQIMTENAEALKRVFSFFHVGRVVAYPARDFEVSGKTVKAVFVGFNINKNLKNPYAPSSVKLRFVISDSQRYIAIPASMGLKINTIIQMTYSNIFASEQQYVIENWNDIIREKSVDRIMRYIITGNILQAYGKDEFKGSLISYTTVTGGIKKGILLPDTFSMLDSGRDGKPVNISVPIVKALELIRGMSNGATLETSGELSITKVWSDYRLYVPSSSRQGAKYYLDEVLRRLSREGTFNKTGSRMEATIEASRLDNLVNYLQDTFSLSVEMTQWQFEQISDKMGPTSYSDEETIGEAVIIEKLVAEDKAEEQRRNEEQQRKTIESELAANQRMHDDNDAMQRDRDNFENEKKRLAIKKKLITLARMLVGDQVSMALGGNISSAQRKQLMKKAFDIGVLSENTGLPRIAAQNTMVLEFIYGKKREDIASLDLLKEYYRGFNHAVQIKLKNEFPEVYG